MAERLRGSDIQPAWSGRRYLTSDQCRAARGLLGISRHRLAAMARVSMATLLHFESGHRAIKPRTQGLIRSALEAAGVEFIPGDGGGEGVRLRRPHHAGRVDQGFFERLAKPAG
ncbi:helix-turn-helix transcriptional regulator [Roseomonas hellenica]|uniref:Helix-turn-helix transcriptional regulator n=1 Tax=Plastoroseomonas hellenica TaxID=2687306 RepID=A0ABS5F8Y2_9PROT|nr:helix-turn-helix transcriptional regulator [Plastoroseomonas hellenica]MBR0668888.1 helix-turn-helix transcriptional regulator [Plastoroseomonas hellenica]